MANGGRVSGVSSNNSGGKRSSKGKTVAVKDKNGRIKKVTAKAGRRR